MSEPLRQPLQGSNRHLPIDGGRKMTPQEFHENNRQGSERFRILVIGNANAGKTTILEKVCNANGLKPEFLDAEGNKTDSTLKPSNLRGEHDIEDQIVYPTARGFIFHDSRGFEAGSTGELEKVQDFIKKRAKEKKLKDQLHAIWYCLPTSNDRALTGEEMSLFKTGTGNVPVIAVFTKMDALDKKVFNALLNQGISPKEARKDIPARAKEKFEQDYLRPLKDVAHPPRAIVQFRDMNKPNTDCKELIIETGKALDGKALKLLYLSAQRNDIETCIEHIIRQTIIPCARSALETGSFLQDEQKSLLRDVMAWFPHILPSFDNEIEKMDKNAAQAAKETGNLDRRFRLFFSRNRRRRDLDEEYIDKCFEMIFPLLVSMIGSHLPHCQVIILGTVLIAIMHHSLFGSSTFSSVNFKTSFDVYMESSSSKELMRLMDQAFHTSDSVVEKDDSKIFGIVLQYLLVV